MHALKTYLYETHLHTMPVSKCAKATVRESLEYYKSLGYDGVFITNHFIDGNINYDRSAPYEDILNFFFSDYENAVPIAKEIGIKVFLGIEGTYRGTDFLIYGLGKEWFLSHPEIQGMPKKEQLAFMAKEGALIIHAHPFREAAYIDHIRLFPRSVHGVETINASRTDFENSLAKQYAKNYDLLSFAGSDNHAGSAKTHLAGMKFKTPIIDEADFVTRVKNNEGKTFVLDANTN